MFKIVRMFSSGVSRTVKRNLTEEQTKAYCKNPETSSATCTTKKAKDRTKRNGDWFDGYSKQ